MSDKSRRKLLKSIAAGSGAVIAGKNLPENWAKPVVDSVMLPAHAQTSTCAYGISETATLPFALTPPGPDVPFGSVGTLTATVTPAPADGQIILLEVFLDGVYQVSFDLIMTGGVGTFPMRAGGVGVIEWRVTYDCAATSIYMNSIPAPGGGAPAGNGNYISG